jgi:hypothetical protein
MSENHREQFGEILYTLATGGGMSTVLEVALDLEVFSKLNGKSVSIDQASILWAMAPPSARALAQSLCFMGLLTYKEGQLANSPLAQTQLVEDAAIREMIHSACRRPQLTAEKIKERLLQPKPLNWYQMRDEGKAPEETDLPEDFYEALHELRIRWGEELATQYDFSKHQTLLDIGGASGGWCLGVRKKVSHLRCIVFDIAPACKVAEKKISEAGQQEYITTATGDFFSQDVLPDADVVLLANVLHDWTIEDDRRILHNVYQALPADGVILVKEFYVQDDWTGAGSAVPAGQALAVLGTEGQCGWQPTSFNKTAD